MRYRNLMAGAAVALVFLSLFVNAGEQADANPIALVDVAKIFKQHPAFAKGMAEIRADVASIEKVVAQGSSEIKALTRQRNEAKSGSPEYRKLDVRIEKKNAEIRGAQRAAKADLLKRESSLYGSVYTEIARLIRGYADARGIILVTRFDSSKMNLDNRSDILKNINRNVVYHAGGLDITDAIIALLE